MDNPNKVTKEFGGMKINMKKMNMMCISLR